MALVLESAKKIRFFYFFIEKTATRYTLFARYISGAHCKYLVPILLEVVLTEGNIHGLPGLHSEPDMSLQPLILLQYLIQQT